MCRFKGGNRLFDSYFLFFFAVTAAQEVTASLCLCIYSTLFKISFDIHWKVLGSSKRFNKFHEEFLAATAAQEVSNGHRDRWS